MRRRVIDSRMLRRIIATIENGASFDDAATASGIAPETWRRYRRQNPSAQDEAEAARRRGRERRRLRRRAELIAAGIIPAKAGERQVTT